MATTKTRKSNTANSNRAPAAKPTHRVSVPPQGNGKYFTEVGAAWTNVDKNGNEYLVLSIHPQMALNGRIFVQPIIEQGPEDPMPQD